MNIPIEITKEELLEAAAEKYIRMLQLDEGNFKDVVTNIVETRVEKAINSNLDKVVNDFLSKELEKLISKQITPIDIWGEPTGKATTLRDSLFEKARAFWDQAVDSEGRATTSWGAKPRYQWLMEKIVQGEFAKAVKDNSDVLVSSFKKALKDSTIKVVNEHFDSLIRTK